MAECIYVTAKDFLKKDNKDAFVLVDIRSTEEYRYEHIKGALHIPSDDVSSVDFTKIAPGKIPVFYCQSGRRTKGCEGAFKRLPLEHVYSLEGGITAWKKCLKVIDHALHDDLSVVRGQAKLPLMRQVQIAVGLIVFIVSLLSYFVYFPLVLINVFVGFGLFFAGMTGFCGLARVLMLLPYNREN